MRFVLRMAWRETRASWARLLFFFVCVALGVAAIVVLRSVVGHVRTTLTREARNIVGADIVIQAQRPWTDDLRAQIDRLLDGRGVVDRTEVVETQTMAVPADEQKSNAVRLVEVRAIEKGYPFYGAPELAGGAPYSHQLVEQHGVLVQPELLTVLGLAVGDELKLAGQTFTIRGVVTQAIASSGPAAASRSARACTSISPICARPRCWASAAARRYELMLRVGEAVGDTADADLASCSSGATSWASGPGAASRTG